MSFFFLAGCCQQVDGFSSGAGTEHCVYSREASPMAPSASLLSSLRLTNSSAATSVWWSTLLRWMKLIRVTPASHFTAESAAAALQVLSCHLVRPDRIPPWRSPWRGGDGSSQSRCKNVLLPWQNCCSMTQLHCLSAAQGAMYPAECTVINHVGKNKRGEWREQGSGGQQPQCFLNNTRLKFTDMMKGRRWRRCRGGLLVSCCDLGLKHNPASAL